MDRSSIINALNSLGEPKNNRKWRDYSLAGFTPADAPRLVELVQDDHFLDSEGDDYWVPLHAWRALRHLMPAGVEALIGTFNAVVEDDWALDELPEVVSAAKAEAIEPLLRFIRDADNDETARMLAIESLGKIGEKYPSLLAKVTDKLEACLRSLPRTEGVLNGALIAQLIDLKATRTIETIRAAFADERVDHSISGDLEDVEIALGLRTERVTPRPNYQQGHQQSLLRNQDPDDAEDEEEGDTENADNADFLRIEQVIRTTPKVGRNDPCPCGSGKKYKKCCGA